MNVMEPTPEQFAEWAEIAQRKYKCSYGATVQGIVNEAIRLAYQAGADEQLQRCVKWMHGKNRVAWWAIEMQTAMRPKPPSLKQQALEALGKVGGFNDDRAVIRSAIESLPD